MRDSITSIRDELNNIYLPIHSNAYIDSGATSNYCPANAPITNKQPDHNPSVVELPDASHLTSTHIGHLPLDSLPSPATKVKVIPGLNKTLVSVGQLVDNGVDSVTFKATHATATINDTTFTIGNRTHNGLWAPLQTNSSTNNDNTIINETTYRPEIRTHNGLRPDSPSDNLNFALAIHNGTWNPLPSATTTDNINMALAIQDRPTQRDLLRYMHATMYSPVKSTLAQAATNKALLGFPGLSPENISKTLPQSMATSFGHMDQQRQGLRSTKPTSTAETDPLLDFLQPEAINERTHCV